MRSRTFLHVSLGILALAASLCAPAEATTLWSGQSNTGGIQFSFGPFTPGVSPITPSALLGGTLPSAGTIGEVAFAQAILAAGDYVPLPQFADGSYASENEVFWSVQLWSAAWVADPCGVVNSEVTNGDACSVSFSGRQMVSAAGVIENQTWCGGRQGFHTTDIKALVTVIAVRQLQPTPAQSESWGGVKARYRGERAPMTTDR